MILLMTHNPFIHLHSYIRCISVYFKPDKGNINVHTLTQSLPLIGKKNDTDTENTTCDNFYSQFNYFAWTRE
jgi:hypothetical protein